MVLKSTNPFNGEIVKEFSAWQGMYLEQALTQVADAAGPWAATPLSERCVLMHRAAEVLKRRRDEFAHLISQEMGKLIGEARAEIDKCAWACEYYAEQGPAFLADELIETDAGKSFVAYQPLGTVLAVMPWNFPFWQVFRFAAPALVAGNTALLKHASNVPQCALMIEEVFRDAGFPERVFCTLMISSAQVARVIEDRRVHAVTLTGSEAAGRKVAATAAGALKKSVLELGGSDPFVVLEDADLEDAVKTAVAARYLNAGQSCIAAKRFIVVQPVRAEFEARFVEHMRAARMGDPRARVG